MPHHCSAKQSLLRGHRPTQAHAYKSHHWFCSSRCIYCDIWKLAALMATRVPVSSRYSTSEPNTPSQDYPYSPSSFSYSTSRLSLDYFDYAQRERAIEAQFQTQRARLASIMSICTVEGAEESQGLRLAHDRCLAIVTELLRQEHGLERKMGIADLREMSKCQDQRSQRSRHESRYESKHESRDCRVQEGWMDEERELERRGRRIGVTF